MLPHPQINVLKFDLYYKMNPFKPKLHIYIYTHTLIFYICKNITIYQYVYITFEIDLTILHD